MTRRRAYLVWCIGSSRATETVEAPGLRGATTRDSSAIPTRGNEAGPDASAFEWPRHFRYTTLEPRSDTLGTDTGLLPHYTSYQSECRRTPGDQIHERV